MCVDVAAHVANTPTCCHMATCVRAMWHKHVCVISMCRLMFMRPVRALANC